MVVASREDRHPASIVTRFLAEHGVIVEKTGLYSFFIMFHDRDHEGRWNTLVTRCSSSRRLRQEPARLWKILPEFCAKHRSTSASDCATCGQQIHDMYKGERRRAGHTEMYLSDMQPGDEAVRRLRAAWRIARSTASRSTSSEGRITSVLLNALSAGHTAADPRRALQLGPSSSTCSSPAASMRSSPGFDTESTGSSREPDATGQMRYYMGLRAA